MQNIKYIASLLCVVLFTQCEVEHKDFKPSNGNADFSNFVAVGDSYTAGYTDGALSLSGQQNSFSYILSEQLSHVGSKDFKQPLIPAGKSIGSMKNGSFYLVETGNENAPIAPNTKVPGNVELLSKPENWVNGQYQNVGVPGAKSFHLLAPEFGNPTLGEGNFNPFYSRFASNPGVSSVLSDALSNNPTFFSCWIGGNDVLSYALAGGEGSVAGVGASDITPETVFDVKIADIINQLTSNGAKGVIANIPYVTAIPYFTTIPYNAMPINQKVIDDFAPVLAGYNQLASAKGYPTIDLVVGNNPFLIFDSSVDLGLAGSGSPLEPFNNVRQATSKDRLLLTARAVASTPEFLTYPVLANKYVLTETELITIKNATDHFNQTLKSMANTNGLAFVDLNALTNKASTTGVLVDGNIYTSTFVSGGTFSLDGIHATGKGNAIIANKFIKAINMKYNANIPLANVNQYSTVVYP